MPRVRTILDKKIAVVSLLCCCLGICATPLAQAQTSAATNSTAALDLTVSDLIQKVLKHNEDLQVKLLDFEASRSKLRSENGIFEPSAYASATDSVDNRQNSSLQAAALLSQPFYHDTNITFDGGIEQSLSTGARFHVGYTISDIRDNLQPVSGFTNGEYQSFFGFSVSQPLFKNFGPAATMVQIRLAALSSTIAFQEYRRQLMTIISTAEASYWNLYFAQEQVRSFEDSVKTAGTILQDAQARKEAGTGSDLDVLEAQSGLALRHAKLDEARQKRLDTANQVISLYAGTPVPMSIPVRAVEVPKTNSMEPEYLELAQTAMEWNPDYLIQEQKRQQEIVRVAYAFNQRLPDLQLKGSYGLNGLGGNPGESWNGVFQDQLDSWSVGLELHVPLYGNIKARNDYHTAQLQLKAAEVSGRSLRSQILAALDTTFNKLLTARNGIQNYHTTVDYNQTLLNAALARLQQGQVESSKVLEVEADLFDAKNSLAESLVRYELAFIELEVMQGALLQDHHIEITQQSLQSATRQFVSGGRLTEEAYQRALTKVHRLYDQTPLGPEPAVQRRLMADERQKVEELTPRPAPAPEPTKSLSPTDRQLLEDERKAIQNLNNGNSPNSTPVPPP
jgi:outer membrane protein TolC